MAVRAIPPMPAGVHLPPSPANVWSTRNTTGLRSNQDGYAAIYRSLRRGLEEAGDSPGAADFYYGEMEARRHGAKRQGSRSGRTTASGERAILTAYWLVSGSDSGPAGRWPRWP